MLHRGFLVRDDRELYFVEVFEIVRETVDICVVECRLHLVENTKRCRLCLEYREHQRDRRHRFFTAGHQIDVLQFFARRLRDDVDAAAAYARSFDGQVEKSIQEGKAFFGTNVIALCQAADVVFLALHGENGENGKVQAAFDLLGIRYTGSGYLGSAIAMDKGLSKQLFWQNEVPTPAGFILRKGEDISLEAHGMTLPCVVKPCCGGSSVGVTIPKTQEEYEAAVADAFSYEDVIVVEEYIKGREFSVGVVDGIAYPIIEIAPIEGFYDYTNKYKAGSTVETCPAVLTKEQTEQMQAYAVKGFKALQLDNYGRLDFMMSKDGKMYCLEANTLPGMTPTSLLPQEAQALGMDFADLCEKLIAVSAK